MKTDEGIGGGKQTAEKQPQKQGKGGQNKVSGRGSAGGELLLHTVNFAFEEVCQILSRERAGGVDRVSEGISREWMSKERQDCLARNTAEVDRMQEGP